MSHFSDAYDVIKGIAEGLGYRESSFLDLSEDAPLSDLNKGFTLRATGVYENDLPAHISDWLAYDLELQVSLPCRSVSVYGESLEDMEGLIKALSLKFAIGEVELGDPGEDFFLSSIPIKTRRH